MGTSNENAAECDRWGAWVREWPQATRVRADGGVVGKMRESHRGMVDGCRWNGGGMGYSRLPDACDNRKELNVSLRGIFRSHVSANWSSQVRRRHARGELLL